MTLLQKSHTKKVINFFSMYKNLSRSFFAKHKETKLVFSKLLIVVFNNNIVHNIIIN